MNRLFISILLIVSLVGFLHLYDTAGYSRETIKMHGADSFAMYCQSRERPWSETCWPIQPDFTYDVYEDGVATRKQVPERLRNLWMSYGFGNSF